MTNDYNNHSIGSFIAEQIVDLAKSQNKSEILDEISIYGLSDKDGSATLSFEWIGNNCELFANEVLDFLSNIKNLIVNLNKCSKEQVTPEITKLGDDTRVLYRFRIWDSEGQYEPFDKKVVNE